MPKNKMRDLLKILPPPEQPLDRDESVLQQNQGFARIEFPTDFVEFGRRYGSGTIRSAYSWEVWSPFRPSYPNIILEFARIWFIYKDACEVTNLPFGIFPEVGGLLPFAKTDGGVWVCWRTDGEPDDWTVVDFYQYDKDCYEELKLSFSDYFVKVLKRQIILRRHRSGESWDPKKDLSFEPVVFYGRH